MKVFIGKYSVTDSSPPRTPDSKFSLVMSYRKMLSENEPDDFRPALEIEANLYAFDS